MTARPPVIIIGMHRSGTSMLTRTLQGLGFYMGRRTTRNEECPFTNALNRWIFQQASATWERPQGVDQLLADEGVRPLVTDYLDGVSRSLATVRFLGPRRYLRYRSMHGIAEPWGWKDPRNTYTLPLWLSVFPEAKVLHIMRHGVDVARSLLVRREQAVEASVSRYLRRRGLYVNNPLAPKRRGFAHSPRCGSLAGGLDMWAEYTARAQRHVAELGEERALELRYESLLRDPLAWLTRITAFCGLEVPEAVLRREAQRFDPERCEAFRHDTELASFAEERAAVLASFGYSL